MEQWTAFRAEQVPAALAEASRLAQASSPDDRPFDAKYQAAQRLEDCGREAARYSRNSTAMIPNLTVLMLPLLMRTQPAYPETRGPRPCRQPGTHRTKAAMVQNLPMLMPMQPAYPEV